MNAKFAKKYFYSSLLIAVDKHRAGKRKGKEEDSHLKDYYSEIVLNLVLNQFFNTFDEKHEERHQKKWITGFGRKTILLLISQKIFIQ